MEPAAHCLDLSRLPPNFVTMMLDSMSLSDRFTCALICKAWAEAAAAVTHTIILSHKVEDLSCLQCWLEKHGSHLEVLQLHKCGGAAALTALPCPQLQDLLLHGSLSIDSWVWIDLETATKLTSVSLSSVKTESQQADVVAALTALPDLEQLTWSAVKCGRRRGLTASVLLQKLTKLTALTLDYVKATEALEHVGGLTRLQHLNLTLADAATDWAAAGCPGLQELKALTRLNLTAGFYDIPPSVSQLTALRQLDVDRATPTALNKLSALTGLTQLRLDDLSGLSSASPPLQLPGLQHFEVVGGVEDSLPSAFPDSCTQLRVLKLQSCHIDLSPGGFRASTMLQHLELRDCSVSAADGADDPVSWQHVFPGPGRLPHLTMLMMEDLEPFLQHADIEQAVACCSNLQVLHLDSLPYLPNSTSALADLPSLVLSEANNHECSSLAQVTGLKELTVDDADEVSTVGLRQLTALGQLTCLCFKSLGWSSRGVWGHMSDGLPGGKPGKAYSLINKAPAGQPPDVSARLLRACDMAAAAEAAPEMLRPQQVLQGQAGLWATNHSSGSSSGGTSTSSGSSTTSSSDATQ